MNDLDLRPPEIRPAPERLRIEIAASLHRAAQPRRTVRLLVAAAVSLLMLTGAGLVAAHLREREPQPSAPGPVGTLDVRRLGPAEAQDQLIRCLVSIPADQRQPDPDQAPISTDPADWTVAYARVQHQRGSAPAESASVLWARDGEALLRCVDGRYDEWSSSGRPPVGDPATVTAPIEEGVPTLTCTGKAEASTPTVLLFHVAPDVRSARVRLVVDDRPQAWQTTGAEGSLVSVPLLERSDLTDLRQARQVSYEVQTLDAAGSPTPIRVIESVAALTTYTQELETCADRAGTPERPTSTAAGVAECLRLAAAGTGHSNPDNGIAPVVFSGPDGFQVVLGDPTAPSLCSLFPTRGVREMGTPVLPADHPPTADDAQQLSISAVDRGEKGVVVWGGGRLRPDRSVASMTFTLPDGAVVPAAVEDGYWVISHASPRPFLDGRPLDQLPPVDVAVATGKGAVVHYTVRFPSVSECDRNVLLPSC